MEKKDTHKQVHYVQNDVTVHFSVPNYVVSSSLSGEVDHRHGRLCEPEGPVTVSLSLLTS